MPEGEKIVGAGSKGWAEYAPSLVGIELTDLTKIEGGTVLPNGVKVAV